MEIQLHTGPSPYFSVELLNEMADQLEERGVKDARTKTSYFLQGLAFKVNAEIRAYMEKK